MKYYKDKNNQVYAYEEDGSQDEFIKGDLVAISKEDADKLIEAERLRNEQIILNVVPTVLSRFQAITILKLTKASKDKSLYQATDDYINSLADDTAENITAKTAWETAQEFRRDSALIKMAQGMFNLTDDQVDEMFRQGAKITA